MQNFNDNWQFKLDDSNWAAVTLPHDWLISDTKNLYKTGIGVYKKVFSVTETVGKRLYLRFDGVYMDMTLHINGQKAGEWKNGYTCYTQEISQYVKLGENVVEVTVNHQSPNSRWYSGAGIYRDCWLLEKNATHFVPDGIYVTASKQDNGWILEVDCEIVGENYEVRHYVEGLTLQPVTDNSFTVENPKIWDITSPNCYTLVSELIVNGQITDVVHTRFGFRQISYSTTDGFHLNGRRVELFGVCQHHDLGGLGAAVNKDALRRQLTILQGMGVNAIRTAHNPPAQALMELTDEMGFVVMSELTDMWKRPKTKYDYARFFTDWVARDVAAWVRRDRNCPSIIMWSVGNEIYDTHASFEDGSATMQLLMDLVREHDPKNHAPSTLCSNYLGWENTQKCADIIKLIGYNYAEYLYAGHHEKNPSWIIYGGETSSTVQSRGIYHFPLSKPILTDDDMQCSALGNSTVSWGAKTSEACIIDHRDARFALGQFLWTGTDYIGEPTPYSTKNSYFGQVDTAGFPKDSYYIYKSAWTFGKDEPFVHLYPYWDWSPGQPIDVRIASNASRVELFLNGKSLGAQEIDHVNGKQIVANYIVPYEAGEIKAVAYGANGQVLAEAKRTSFGDAVKIATKSEVYGELTFTEIFALDADGNTVENANNRVNVIVNGGELLALDNGDSTDYDQYQGTDNRRLFSGKLLAIHKGGAVVATLDDMDIPIRKIVLTARDNNVVEAEYFPKNATHTKLDWRLATDNGISSPLGKLDINGSTATLIPVGDGDAYIRCTASNGQPHPTVMSSLPINLTGYGQPLLDPYARIPAGLYSKCNKPMGNGHDRGLATVHDGENIVGYTNVNFGSFGADEITLGIFTMHGNPFPIDIWLGFPEEEGARKLTTVTYDRGTQWNVYVPQTYKLPERICGVQTISFTIHAKIHMNGFRFTGKTFEQIPFAAHDNIYGDNFTVQGSTVEKIGNNVSITFGGINFTAAEKNAAAVELSYRSNLDTSTIRLIFTNENGHETINTLNLPKQENYAPYTVELDTPLTDSGKVSFIFLPGSDIDLEWFRLKT